MDELPASNDATSMMDAPGEVRSDRGEADTPGKEPLRRLREMFVEREECCRQDSDNCHEAVWLVGLGKKGRVLYVSPSCRHLIGCTPQEIYRDRRKWLSVVCKTDRRQVWECIKNIKDGRLEGHEFRVIKPDGSVSWVYNEGWPVGRKGKRPVGMTGVIRDISETKRLKEELIDICEHEHRHIARELDDGISQHLTGTSLVCKVLYNKLAARKDPAAPDMARICRLLHTAVSEARFLSRGLDSVRAGQEWLAEALTKLSSITSSLFAVSCLFRCGGEIAIPSANAAKHLYRIAKEAVNNAIRHGEAGKIHIKLRRKNDRIVLSISDNGRGFQPPEEEGKRGVGLRMMAYRAAESGGQLKIGPGKYGGTVVECTIPAC